jgi:O-ureido-D-serine cyclo-ligase
LAGTAAKNRSIALVSARAAQGLDEDMPPLLGALQAAGADAQAVNWDDGDVDWARFGLALLRSTWDASIRLAEFLDWSERVSKQTNLLNPVPVIRWNTDKRYMRDLARAGVPIVPTEFVAPGTDVAPAVSDFLNGAGSNEVVVKPAVGSGSRHARRHPRSELAAIRAHVDQLLDMEHTALLQPYLERVDEYGETALLYFEGRFSHAIRKGPMLRAGGNPTEQLFAAETITPRVPTEAELAVGERAVSAIPGGPLLYARVDLIRDSQDQPCVLELELTEPSVFLPYAVGAAERFARLIIARAR